MKYIIIIIIILLIIFRYYKLKFENTKKIIKNKYKNIKNKFNTGDLILFSYNTNISDIIKVISNSLFTHIGLVIKINNELYLLECDTESYYDYVTKKIKVVFI